MLRGNKCAYYMCRKSPRNSPKLSLFGFPNDLERSRTWVSNSVLVLKLSSTSVNTSTVVMSQSGDDSLNENEGEQVVNLIDFINDENAEIERANLILGASEGDSCTYAMGYMKRQALFACITCTEEGKLSGAICLPCVNHCHENHNLIELWTKRNYRCDCGSDKFTSTCQLEPTKPEANDLNVYNHNFKGLYCICQRPYPDSDNTDEMIQCIVCEDWYHSKHLGTKDVDPEDYSEMICSSCTSKLSFLPAYKHLIVTDSLVQNLEKDDETEHVDVVNTEMNLEALNAETLENVDVSKNMKSEAGPSTSEICKLVNDKVLKKITGSSFWVEGWRQELCRCSTCKELYKSEGVSFIIDEQDTLQVYENKSREKISAKEKQSEEGLSQALSSMDRVAAVELVHQYNQFKEDLGEWLNSFENGKVVKVDDVKEFFSGMQARKRARMDDGVPPNFCR